MKTVQVLMSTYNGMKYLEEQLDSILKQSYQNIQILIRDDGSVDKTIDILEAYSCKYDNITYYQGKNVGVIQSFMDLIYKSSDEADYYCFADQDDVWLPEKIEKAVKILQKETAIPFLYCGNTYVTDAKLQIITKGNKSLRPSLGNALVQNVCAGCTACINKKLRDIVRESHPKKIVMHDWWLYITAELFGKVYYDDEAYILYRQHGNNEYGLKTSRWQIWKYRFGQLGKKRGYIFRQLEEVISNYPDITSEQKDLIEKVLKAETGFKNKLTLVLDKNIYRNLKKDDIVYRIIILIGKL